MERSTRSVMLVFTRCTDPKREKQFNDWYDNVHIAHILENQTPGLITVKRYEVRPSSTEPGRARYVAVYEMSSPEPDAVYARMRATMNKRRAEGSTYSIDCLERVNLSCYRRQTTVHPPGLKADSIDGTQGIMVALLQPKPGAKEKTFEDWYVGTHLKDAAMPGIFHTVSRFVNTDPKNGGKSLTLLETDWKDVEKACEKQKTFFPKFTYPKGIKDTYDRVVVAAYQRVL